MKNTQKQPAYTLARIAFTTGSPVAFVIHAHNIDDPYEVHEFVTVLAPVQVHGLLAHWDNNIDDAIAYMGEWLIANNYETMKEFSEGYYWHGTVSPCWNLN